MPSSSVSIVADGSTSEIKARVGMKTIRATLIGIGPDALAADMEARPIDFSALALIVIPADEDDLAGHAALLADIDKASGGHAVWRTLAQPATPGAMAQ